MQFAHFQLARNGANNVPEAKNVSFNRANFQPHRTPPDQDKSIKVRSSQCIKCLKRYSESAVDLKQINFKRNYTAADSRQPTGILFYLFLVAAGFSASADFVLHCNFTSDPFTVNCIYTFVTIPLNGTN